MGGAWSSKPTHCTTGTRGYFGNLASTSLSPHRQKVEPRAEVTGRA